jgi:hypothetical protein
MPHLKRSAKRTTRTRCCPKPPEQHMDWQAIGAQMAKLTGRKSRVRATTAAAGQPQLFCAPVTGSRTESSTPASSGTVVEKYPLAGSRTCSR